MTKVSTANQPQPHGATRLDRSFASGLSWNVVVVVVVVAASLAAVGRCDVMFSAYFRRGEPRTQT